MSDDLISRNALLEDFLNTITEQSGTMDWLNMIARRPVAYDVEKVVEQLEQKANDAISNHYAYEDDDHERIYNDGVSDGYDKAIEIVKAGWVE